MRPIEPGRYNKRAGWIVVGSVAAIFLLVMSCQPTGASPWPRGSGGVTNLPVPATVAAGYSPAPAPAADDGIGEGVYEVGADMPAGKYKTAGAIPSDAIPSCYYARLKHNDGAFGDIIANDSSTGQLVVTVKVGEYFKTSGCQGWRKVG
jgi:hypothetical protein